MPTPDQDLRVDPEESARRFQRRGSGIAPWIAALVVAAACAAAAYWWWSERQPTPSPPVVAASAPAVAPAQPASSSASEPSHPVQTASEGPMSAADIDPALVELLGTRAVAAFLQTSDFPRRFAATVDNLGRAHAPSAVWPVQPSPGQFTVEDGPEGTVIAQANARRYTPFVQMAGAVDAKRAADLYRRMYPLLQQAWRELGFGKRYLNDRVIEVIDLLLATPEPERPPRVQLTEVKGPIPSMRPWVRYEYVDPQLESLTAGQKILVRMGVANERRLKQKLRELRAQLA